MCLPCSPSSPPPLPTTLLCFTSPEVFEDYGADHNALLETAYAGGQKCAKFTHRQFIYTADFVKLEQCNVSTQVARPMRRVTVTSAIAHSPLASAIPVPMPRAKGIPLRYCPVDSGLVPASVTIEVQGTAAYVNAACDKLKALLQKSITDKKVSGVPNYVCVCVCVCVCACVHACVHACVRACVHAYIHAGRQADKCTCMRMKLESEK